MVKHHDASNLNDTSRTHPSERVLGGRHGQAEFSVRHA